MSTATATRPQLDEFTRAYVECALWSSTGDDGEPLDKHYSASDIGAETLDKMAADCKRFQAENWEAIADDLQRAGYDFWLTRQHHGAGFWDGDWPESGDALTDAAHKFGESDLYIGDDGQFYLM